MVIFLEYFSQLPSWNWPEAGCPVTGGSGVPVTFFVVAGVDVSSVTSSDVAWPAVVSWSSSVVSLSTSVVDRVVGDAVGVVGTGVVGTEEKKLETES